MIHFFRELLRKIASSSLKSTNDAGSKKNASIQKLTGNDDKQFEFKDMKYLLVDFCEANSLSYDGLAPVVDWLRVNL